MYIIVESKFGTARLGTVNPLVPGPRIKQMSMAWIESSNRIANAVDGDATLTDEILINYVPVVAKIDSLAGTVTFIELDEFANEIGPWTP